MKKVLLTTLVVVALVLLLVGVFLGAFLGRAVTAAVNAHGPELTGTRVTLAEASLSPFTGSGTLRDFVVGNPDGFKAPNALSVAEAHLAVKPTSLLGDVLDIRAIEIRQPRFDYETTLFSSNLGTILDRIEKATGGKKPSADQPADGPARKVMIRHFLLEDAQVTVTIAGTSLMVPLARLELHDVGVAKGGVTPAEAAREISQQILAAVLDAAKRAIAENPATLGDRAKETGRKIGDAAKELWEKATGGK